MALPNSQRNEVLIKINQHEYLARPTFAFIAEIEEYFDLPLTNIVINKFYNGAAVKVKEIATIIEAGVRAAGGQVDVETLQNDIAEAGTASAIEAVVPLLNRAFGGNEKLAKKK